MVEEGIGIGSFETEIDVVDWRGHARVPGDWAQGGAMLGRGVGALVGQGKLDRGPKLVEARGRSRLPSGDLCLYGQGDVGPSLRVGRVCYGLLDANTLARQQTVSCNSQMYH